MTGAACALLAILGLAALGPDLLPRLLGGSASAWDYVLTGAQTAALWVVAFAVSPHWLWRVVCALGAWEAAQRPLCRALLPMDRAPKTGSRSLCEVALGDWIGWAGLVLLLFVALLAQESHRAARG